MNRAACFVAEHYKRTYVLFQLATTMCIRVFEYVTMDDVIEQSAPYLVEAAGMSLDEAVSFMGALLPTLNN